MHRSQSLELLALDLTGNVVEAAELCWAVHRGEHHARKDELLQRAGDPAKSSSTLSRGLRAIAGIILGAGTTASLAGHIGLES